MKVAAVADLHGRLPRLDPCDLLVIAGDVCPLESAERQRGWLERELRPWLERLDADAIVGVAGNCDLVAAEDPGAMRSLPWRYLEGEAASVAGLSVFGSPLSLPFGEWPFMEPEERLAEVWSRIPADCDLLVVHGPPHGLGDLASNGRNAGSPSLRRRLDELPRLQAVVSRHIHEGRGEGAVGAVRWVNAAAAGGEPAVVLELQPR